MSIIAIRGIRLSSSTKRAWKNADVYFANSHRTTEEILDMGFDHIINLGKSSFKPTLHYDQVPIIWNHGNDIEDLIWPGYTRKHLTNLMPPFPTEFPAEAWIKTPGAHGRGKFLEEIKEPLSLPKRWDWQKHIEGTEYRIITVGHKVVQVNKRSGDNNNRQYTWLGLGQAEPVIKRTARKAAKLFSGLNIIGWDLIQEDHTDLCYILEGNSCPGVNDETAIRIVTEIVEQGRNYEN